MKYTLLLCLFFPVLLNAIDPTWCLQGGIGYRKDRIDWNFKDRCVILPRAKSNVQLDNQDIFQVAVNGRACPWQCLFMRFDADYGWICHGSNHERFSFDSNFKFSESYSSYYSNSYSSRKRGLAIKSHSSLKGKWVADVDAGLGFPFFFFCTPLELIPMAGYSYHTQHITASRSSHIRRHIPRFMQKFINSRRRETRYEADWYGPWVGCDYEYNTYEFWNVYGGVEFHIAQCNRKRTSSIGIPFIDGFSQTSKAHGTIVRWGTKYFFDCNAIGSVELYYRYFSCKNKNDHLAWRSLAMTLNVGYGF